MVKWKDVDFLRAQCVIMGVEKQPAITLSSFFVLFTFLFPNLGKFWSTVVVWELFVLSWDQINLIFLESWTNSLDPRSQFVILHGAACG